MKKISLILFFIGLSFFLHAEKTRIATKMQYDQFRKAYGKKSAATDFPELYAIQREENNLNSSIYKSKEELQKTEQEIASGDSIKRSLIFQQQALSTDSATAATQLKTLLEQKAANEQQLHVQMESNTQWWKTGILLSLVIGLFSLIFWLILYRYRSVKQAKLSSIRGTLNALQQKLIDHEVLASRGELTSAVAHEIRNPLNFINNFTDISKELFDEYLQEDVIAHRTDLLGDIRENIEKVQAHSKRASGIISGMSGENNATGGIDLQNLLHESVVLATYNNQARTFKIEEDYDTQVKTVIGNRSELQRVFLNIISNAVYALNKKCDDAPSDWKPELKIKVTRKSDHLYISISDNGPGIPAKVSEKLFTPFFTTKPAGAGTGLGLSMSKEIVEKHNGSITMNSFEGKGTSFYILLPILTVH